MLSNIMACIATLTNDGNEQTRNYIYPFVHRQKHGLKLMDKDDVWGQSRAQFAGRVILAKNQFWTNRSRTMPHNRIFFLITAQ